MQARGAVKACGTILLLAGGVVYAKQTDAPGAASATMAANVRPNAGTPAAVVTAVLQTSISSKNTAAGKEIKAVLRKEIRLPDGTRLPAGTMLSGRVEQVSTHSRSSPNGALLLVLNSAKTRDGTTVPVVVIVRALAASVASENEVIQLPGVRLGGTGNSGGAEQLVFNRNDRSDLHSNLKQSGLTGIYIDNKAGGSGTFFAVDEDVFLDGGVQLKLLIARTPSTPK